MERPMKRLVANVAFLFLLVGTAFCEPSGTDLVPLRTKLPKPVFVGTPRLLVSPNLERVTGKVRGEYRIPKGCANLAAERPVTASDTQPFIGRTEMVTDGDKEGDGDSFVELGMGKQWVQIDLGSSLPVFAILVWHYHGEPRVYHDIVVQLADDPDFANNPRTVFNNDHDNSSGLGVGTDKEYIETFEGRLIPVEGLKARYVRLYSNGNTTDDMNDYVEVEVFGQPAAPEP
jgi:hypothetical protein